MPNPILIAVPPHLVPAVTAILANDGEQPDEATGSQTSLIHGWTESAISQHYADSSENMRAFLVLLAQNAGNEVSSHAAAETLGFPDWNSVAGMLGAAQRRANNHFGRSEGPWQRRWARDGHARFRMPSDVAALILREAEAHGNHP